MTELVAREALRLAEGLAARLTMRSAAMRSVVEVQALYIATSAMLRAVGHVFKNVDCDDAERQAWAAGRWRAWSGEPIFALFIEPDRNSLLKEFRGSLGALGQAMGSYAISARPDLPDGSEVLADFDALSFVDGEGVPIVSRVEQAIEFWDQRLGEAERAFASMPARSGRRLTSPK